VDTEVLIVGAGPTGLMLANQLARRGLRPLIIDRHPGPSLQTRALGVQARTLEIYAKMGLAERAIGLGKRGNGAHLWSEGRQIGAVSLSDVGTRQTPYAYILVLGQDDNERLMGDKLRELGVAIQWNTELLALEQHSSHVVATLKQADGQTRTIEAAWVAGCDGARSAVRTLTGIDFPGAPYEHVFFVADVTRDGQHVSR
jgi:2-polyprenyl-6-methoxyphenol hydroxylase-like FAD-dependent oxidoreductase